MDNPTPARVLSLKHTQQQRRTPSTKPQGVNPVKHLQTAFQAAWIVTLLSCLGCETLYAPPQGQPDMLPAWQYPNIAATPDTLSKALVFGQPIVTPSSESKPLSISVPIRSLENDYKLNIQYRFEYYDQQSRLIDTTAEGWRFQQLSPLIQTQLQGNALDQRAVTWRLIVRSAQ
jgi:hypothetical protein